ncbi:TPA: hypothetical protein ACJJLW_002135, partial [Neisseria meningitidis]
GVSIFSDRFLWFFGCWIPAFAGMTVGGVSVFADRFLWFFGCWIPAFAGMTAVGFRFFPIKSCCVAFLDSRLRGNDGRRTANDHTQLLTTPFIAKVSLGESI